MVKPLPPVRHPICRRAGVQGGIFIADRGRGGDPLATLGRLAPGTIVLYRDYDSTDRAAYGRLLAKECRARHLPFFVAGDARLARRLKADGLHLPEYQLFQRPAVWNGFTSAAVHGKRALHVAAGRGVGLMLVSPVFPTRSHPGAKTLGPHRLARLIGAAGGKVAALGGINADKAGRLKGLGLAAVAMMDGWT